MKKIPFFLLLLILFSRCSSPSLKNDPEKTTGKTVSGPLAEVVDTTPRITGIGGIFFYSEDPEQTREWYADMLGLTTDDYGAVFEFRNGRRPDEVNYLRWSPFQKGSDYLAPSQKEFMINYRVQNLEGLIRNLEENGAMVVGEIETYPYGKFAYVMDPDGQKIELWEPIDSVLTQMGGQTNK
ncbi:MAG: VOC family protein [Bacteroidales bacterium]|jgi:predicted enzyme related to lactoylglutathione lyase|nr:VOC family protein [Bacteroidales bacterium]NLM91564.1 VOC family protein [Bacteroidales bacterium]